ncbi:MAG: SURF1 family protein [Alphaproteobacteria bacterium]
MFRPLLWPTVFTIAALTGLVLLGTWQLDRLDWKQDLTRRVTAQAHASPTPLPARAQWPTLDLNSLDYRPVVVRGTFDHLFEIHVYTVIGTARGTYSGPGYWVVTPLVLVDGGAVIVNRGFVPTRFKAAKSRLMGQVPGIQTIKGMVRQTEIPGFFTPAPDLANNVWVARDLPAMASALGRADLAPFIVDAGPTPEGLLPQGGETRLKFINNHLSYALTWYGLGIVLIGVYLTFHRAQGRLGKPKPDGQANQS